MPVAGIVMIAAGAAAGVTTLAGAMLVIGGVMSTVGYVTENKDLSMAGSVLGLIGGGVSAFGGTGTAASTSSELATASASGTAADAAAGTGAAGTTSAELALTEGAIDSGALGGASQVGTGATVTDVGGSALTAGQSGAIGGPATTTLSSPVAAGQTGAIGGPATTTVGAPASGSDLVGPGVYNPAGTVSGASPSAANLAGTSDIASTVKGIVSSKEFWNGSMQALGGYMQGEGNKSLADAQLQIARDKMAVEQANGNAVPELGNRLKANPNATPFTTGAAPTYLAPNYQYKAPAVTPIMGGK
jgi:hypothetical protein